MAPAEHKDFDQADEVRTFTNGRVELLHIGGSDIGRLILQPGWRWSDHVKPLAGTDLCEAPHFQYHVSGTLRIEMADGTQFDAVPGQVTAAVGPRRLGHRRRAGRGRRLVGRQQLRQTLTRAPRARARPRWESLAEPVPFDDPSGRAGSRTSPAARPPRRRRSRVARPPNWTHPVHPPGQL